MRSGGIELLNIDCMEYMSTVPDKFFELAIVDPPYGINMSSDFTDLKRWSGKDYNEELTKKDWDKITPSKEYWQQLFRVSKNQIVWGGNYFIEHLYNSACVISWWKSPDGSFTADCEIAWTSFKTKCRIVKMFNTISGDNRYYEKRIHPTQKPYQLYEWLLKEYGKEGDKILDTHLGSGSIAIACHKYKFELTACEIDKDYYEAATKRVLNHIAQTSLF